MDSTFTERWIRKFRMITLSLIFSGALNIGLIAAFVAVLMQDREKKFTVLVPKSGEIGEESTNQILLNKYAHLSFRELCSLLTNTDIVEEGFRKRDLALSILVSFQDFNLEKAIGSIPLQRRLIKMDAQSIEMFPNISEDQFQAILHYAYLEKWPLTSHGLFKALQKCSKPCDESLIQAFLLTSEFYALQNLFQKSNAPLSQEQLMNLITEGTWEMLDGFFREQSQMLDFSIERRQHLLLSYLAKQSHTAADLLLQTDFMFALKRLDDQGIIDLLSRVSINETVQKFCLALLASARSDAVYEKSIRCLYHMAKQEVPEPLDLSKEMTRFVPKSQVPKPASKKETTVNHIVSEKEKRVHVVKAGDSLWKISRQYHVKVNDLVTLNHLEKDQLKIGAELKIPQGTGSNPPR